jgi:hypothetical protein
MTKGVVEQQGRPGLLRVSRPPAGAAGTGRLLWVGGGVDGEGSRQPQVDAGLGKQAARTIGMAMAGSREKERPGG